ncbi:MAG: cytochrome C biogenesis protein, partial [Verrucomicrobiota bacterium]
MKRWIPWVLVIVMAGWVAGQLAPKSESGFHTGDFGRLPILMNGRFQPMESLARNSLLQIRTKQTVYDATGARPETL